MYRNIPYIYNDIIQITIITLKLFLLLDQLVVVLNKNPSHIHNCNTPLIVFSRLRY